LYRTVCGVKVYGRCGDMVQGLARGPLKAEIRVRIPVSLPLFLKSCTNLASFVKKFRLLPDAALVTLNCFKSLVEACSGIPRLKPL
jgi:hypothetical protein